MFGCSDDVLVINARPLTLQSLDDRHAHARDQVRVFAVSLFCATPARLARKIKVWAKHEVAAVRASFERGGSEDSVDDVCIPTAGECNRRRETRSLRSHEAVQKQARMSPFLSQRRRICAVNLIEEFSSGRKLVTLLQIIEVPTRPQTLTAGSR